MTAVERLKPNTKTEKQSRIRQYNIELDIPELGKIKGRIDISDRRMHEPYFDDVPVNLYAKKVMTRFLFDYHRVNGLEAYKGMIQGHIDIPEKIPRWSGKDFDNIRRGPELEACIDGIYKCIRQVIAYDAIEKEKDSVVDVLC